MGYPVFEGETMPPVDEKALAAINLRPERLKIIAEAEIDGLKEMEAACGIKEK